MLLSKKRGVGRPRDRDLQLRGTGEGVEEPAPIILMVPAGEIVDDHIKRLRSIKNAEDRLW